MLQPPIIKYNLTERGRQYRGAERNFNIPAIVDSVNGPATQERVATRGMLGFFGHWPRLKFGMEPAEGGIAEGRAQAIEPALVTTKLIAYDDGTIEHQAEFLDTATGQLASRLFANRVGGFSSAIDVNRPELFGFDYVNDPNYSTNRGYDLLLDSVATGEMTFDDVVIAEQAEQTEALNRLFAVMDANLRLVMDTADRLERENLELLDLLAKREPDPVKAVALDSSVTARLERDRQAFHGAILPQFSQPDAVYQAVDRDYARLRRSLGF